MHGEGVTQSNNEFVAAWPGQPRDKQQHSDNDILVCEGVSLRFGGLVALNNVSFKVRTGEFFSVIGPNGAGKTSLMNCISGRYQPTAGNLTFEQGPLLKRKASDRAKLGIARKFQNLALFAHMSVLDNILVGCHHLMKSNLFTEGLYWLSNVQSQEAKFRRDVEDLIDFLEIEKIRHAPAGSLSYGLRKRVELARALAIKPKLLLLDEPMAGMNLEEKEDMVRYIVELNRERGITVVMIEHDMNVVMDISDRVVVLNYGEVIAEGLPSEVLQNPMVKRAYLGDEN